MSDDKEVQISGYISPNNQEGYVRIHYADKPDVGVTFGIDQVEDFMNALKAQTQNIKTAMAIRALNGGGMPRPGGQHLQ